MVHILYLGIRITSAHGKADDGQPLKLMAIGLATILVSYSIYGIAATYTPILHSLLNRINYAGCAGAALILAGGLGWLSRSINHRKSLILTAVMAPLVVLLVLADWGMSLPWINSWRFQTAVKQKIIASGS